jgi:hypothetical protein
MLLVLTTDLIFLRISDHNEVAAWVTGAVLALSTVFQVADARNQCRAHPRRSPPEMMERWFG